MTERHNQLALLLCLVASSVAHAEVESSKTRGGNEFGLAVSTYRYEEPSLGMSTTGDKFSVSHTGTLVLNGDWFVKEDSRFAYGSVDYVGSGFQIGVPDWFYDVRGLSGRDVQVGSVMLSPYIGLGYRHLFNDLRGYSNTGSVGYRRDSNYLYIPLGLTHRFAMQDGDILETTFEYDFFVQGWQNSMLSDASLGNPDVLNTQRNGFGYRAEVMYMTNDWAFGPFLNVWNINKSDEVVRYMLCKGQMSWCILSEPQNRTTEFGLRTKFRF